METNSELNSLIRQQNGFLQIIIMMLWLIMLFITMLLAEFQDTSAALIIFLIVSGVAAITFVLKDVHI